MHDWNAHEHAEVLKTGPGKLTKPAQVGNTRFGIGIDERVVIERAQREYEYQVTPDREAERIARAKAAIEAYHRDVWAFVPGEEADVRKPNKKVQRGLQWILGHAEAIYADVAEEKGTGQFAGTSPKEVVEAMEWLQAVINKARSERKTEMRGCARCGWGKSQGYWLCPDCAKRPPTGWKIEKDGGALILHSPGSLSYVVHPDDGDTTAHEALFALVDAMLGDVSHD